ncbi:MAG: alpha/beta hydrolase fold domain-containing protein [Enhydrobacter sp.]|nr:MAG: alpha/beta hydrolase fold domain-containing protein [Enhydrobacter sp.]
MTDEGLPVWQRPGSASAIYAKFAGSRSLRDQWVQMVRASWGNPDHPELCLFQDVTREDGVVRGPAGRAVPVTVMRPPGRVRDAFLYLHGGGWVAPLSGKHVAWAKRLASLTGQEIHCVEYGLAPEKPFPQGLEDCLVCYNALRSRCDGQVSVGGDSSGGNLALALALYCADHGVRRPDRIAALSPATDMHFEDYPAFERLGRGNPIADPSVLAFQRACYLSRADWQNPYASPMLGRLEALPLLFILAGGQDPLHEENLVFARKCEAAGVPTTVYYQPDLPHAFHTHHDVLPAEADAANAAIAAFLGTPAG